MCSQFHHSASLQIKLVVALTTCLALNNTVLAGSLLPVDDEGSAANTSLQHLANLHSECLYGAIRKEEAEGLLSVISVLNLNQYCKKTRQGLEKKTSKLKTKTFETVYLNSYYLAKAGKLVRTLKPVDSIVDLEQ